MFCRSCASNVTIGGSDSVTRPSQANVASTSAPIIIEYFIVVSVGSVNRNGDGDLVRGHAHFVERQRPTRSGEDASRSESSICSRREYPSAANTRTSGSVQHAALVADLELRESKTQTPRGLPLDPALRLCAARQLREIVLLHCVTDAVHSQTKLDSSVGASITESESLLNAHTCDRIR